MGTELNQSEPNGTEVCKRKSPIVARENKISSGKGRASLGPIGDNDVGRANVGALPFESRETQTGKRRSASSSSLMHSAATTGLRRVLASLHPSAFSPNYAALGSLIQQCTDQSLWLPGRQLHARLILLSIRPGNFLGSKLITFYSNAGDLRCARLVFDDLPERNIFAWNAMLIAYCFHDRRQEALSLFSLLLACHLRPDNFTITCLLKACSSSSDEVHAYVLRNGLESDIFLINALVTVYARTGDLVAARQLFDQMPERDVVSWNAMIGAYAQSERYEESLQMYEEMKMVGLRPDEITVVSALQACSSTQDLRRGMQIQEDISRIGIPMDTPVWNSLIALYAKCGNLRYAQKLLDEMPKRDSISWGSIIMGYMQYGYCSKAMEMFEIMKNGREDERPSISTWNTVIAGLVQNGWHENVSPMIREMQMAEFRLNSVTISSILPLCSYFSDLRSGQEIHGFAIRSNCDQNVYVATALIDMYSKTGSLEEACRVFTLTSMKSSFVWTSIIAGYAAHGHADSCFSWFQTMVESGVKPDSVTLTSVLTSCSRAGLLTEAQWVFESMLANYGIIPTPEHCACMVDAYGRNGLLKKALSFITEMHQESSPRAWGALLSAALVHNNAIIGELAANRLFEIEPENEGNYVLLANIYAQAGKWEEAKAVRRMMKDRGLKKGTGYSWIESNEEKHCFDHVGDES